MNFATGKSLCGERTGDPESNGRQFDCHSQALDQS